MRILSITAGAANMYCGSCLRDNALARELLGRGHDVTLQPVYTPTVTDEENVSAGHVLFGGVSVYLQQHVGLFRRTPWLLDKLWDSTAFLKLVSRRSIQVDPGALGALTISTLKGERGFQRKEIEKLVAWLREEPPYDVINLPNTLLISLAEPIRRATGRPLVVTLQGEDLFLDGLPPRDRDRAIALIREQVPHVDLFVSVSEYYRDYMAGYLGIPLSRIRVAPLGVSLRDLEPTPRLRTAGDPFVVGYFARVAPEKSLHLLAEAYRILRRERGVEHARLEAAGYLAPEHRPYLSTASSGTTARWTAPRRWHSFTASTCSRCRARTRSRRGCTCSRRWRAACRSWRRSTAHFPRCSRRPPAGCSCDRTIRAALPTGWPRSGTIRRRRARWDAAARPACNSITALHAWRIT
jgi:glycosyltransferase involved in cell wall biosynthesis